MENYDLFKIDVDGSILSAKITNADTLELLFRNGDKIVFADCHSQDCCERVYADWSNINIEKLIDNMKNYSSIVIKGVEDMGILLVFNLGFIVPIKEFVPCYNIQNGYYSTDLNLTIYKNDNEIATIDISKFESFIGI